MSGVLTRVSNGIRPHTKAQYIRQFRLFLAYAVSRGLFKFDHLTTVLLFTEFLVANAISHKVILNYISALKFMFARYKWDLSTFQTSIFTQLLRGIKLSLPNHPAPKGTLDLSELRHIAYLCGYFDNSQVYKSAFLLAFYAFLRISNVAPPFQRGFDPSKHLLREDVKVAYPGMHIRLKWAKNIQAPEKVHWIKIPQI